jgi:hypothetical protein
MKMRLSQLASVLVAAGIGSSALGQPDTPVAPVPQDQVEILVFAHRDFDANEERFSAEYAAFPDESNALLNEPPRFDESNFLLLPPPPPPDPFAAAADPFAATPDPLATAPKDGEFRFRLLRPEELQLNDSYRRIRALGAYVPLLHAGWLQPGLPEAESRPFDLALVGARNPRGNVRLHLSRFLHVSLDLTYQEPPAASQAAALPVFGNELTELAIAPHYRLVTSRQARSGELHYFDHPAFGVLVRITPVTVDPNDVAPGRPAA